MTTSGTADYNPAVVFIIQSALRKIGAIAEDEVPTAAMQSDCLRALNAMVKEWQATGIHVWKEEEAILFPQPGQSRFVLGGTTADHCCDAYSYVQTNLTANVAGGSNAVPVASSLGMSPGDPIGITMNNGLVFWTTVGGGTGGTLTNDSGVVLTNDSGVVLTADSVSSGSIPLQAALPSAASNGAIVVSYTQGTDIIKPLRVPFARRLNLYGTPQILIPMISMSHADFMDLPNPGSPGTPTQFFYQPKLSQGWLYIWPTSVATNNAIRFTYLRPLDIYITNANTSDFPEEWTSTLIFNLALEIAPEYDMPPPRFAMLKSQADQKMQRLMGFDKEPEAVYFGLSYDTTAR